MYFSNDYQKLYLGVFKSVVVVVRFPFKTKLTFLSSPESLSWWISTYKYIYVRLWSWESDSRPLTLRPVHVQMIKGFWETKSELEISTYIGSWKWIGIHVVPIQFTFSLQKYFTQMHMSLSLVSFSWLSCYDGCSL